MGPAGLEPANITNRVTGQLEKTQEQSGALSGAESDVSEDFDADLRKVMDAWPTLPETVRRNIVAMVEALCVQK